MQWSLCCLNHIHREDGAEKRAFDFLSSEGEVLLHIFPNRIIHLNDKNKFMRLTLHDRLFIQEYLNSDHFKGINKPVSRLCLARIPNAVSAVAALLNIRAYATRATS